MAGGISKIVEKLQDGCRRRELSREAHKLVLQALEQLSNDAELSEGWESVRKTQGEICDRNRKLEIDFFKVVISLSEELIAQSKQNIEMLSEGKE